MTSSLTSTIIPLLLLACYHTAYAFPLTLLNDLMPGGQNSETTRHMILLPSNNPSGPTMHLGGMPLSSDSAEESDDEHEVPIYDGVDNSMQLLTDIMGTAMNGGKSYHESQSRVTPSNFMSPHQIQQTVNELEKQAEHLDERERELDNIETELRETVAHLREEEANLREEEAHLKEEEANLREEEAHLKEEEANLKEEEANMAQKSVVIFVVGGPGCGKSTHCSNAVEKFGVVHISAGDCLREEEAREESPFSEAIKHHIGNGQVVPSDITCQLLTNKIRAHGPGKAFLIDGFPRNEENLNCWHENPVSSRIETSGVLCFSCSETDMAERALSRGSQRNDDTPEILTKRFATHHQSALPVEEQLRGQAPYFDIDSSGTEQQTWQQVEEALTSLLLHIP